MIKKNNKWFTLIEIMISTIILWTWVFWVYKLIWSNMSVISSMWEDIVVDSLSINAAECIKNIWYYSLLIWDSTFFLDFWTDYTSCNVWLYDNNFSNTWIILDDWEYYIIWNITDSWSVIWSEFLDIQIKVIWDNTKDVITNLVIKK